MFHVADYNPSHKWVEEDQRWFEEHPHRAYRIRAFVEEELESLPGPKPFPRPRYTVIRQVEPGVRARAFLWTVAPNNDDEEAIAELWHRIASRTFPPDLLRAMDEREHGGRLQ